MTLITSLMFYQITRYSHKAVSTDMVFQQDMLIPPNTWPRPIWNLYKLYLLRPILFSILSWFFRNLHFELHHQKKPPKMPCGYTVYEGCYEINLKVSHNFEFVHFSKLFRPWISELLSYKLQKHRNMQWTHKIKLSGMSEKMWYASYLNAVGNKDFIPTLHHRDRCSVIWQLAYNFKI